MKIETAELHLVRIPFKGAFQHALKRRTEAETIIVVVRSASGAIGIGEIAPRPYLTGETIEGVLERTAPAQARRCLGKTLSSREETVAWLRAELDAAGRNLATFAGFELAILDVAGKELRFSAGDVLGGSAGPDLPPGVVIGFEVATSDLKKHCAMLRMTGRKHVKVKVGQADDVERIEIISRSLGAALPLRLDANGVWTADEAIARLLALRHRFNIASVEQPIASNDLDGLRRVRAETGIKVMADESLCSLEDGRRLIAAEAADIFNIRIGKCGGLLGSLRLVELARQAGLGVHLGALVGETAVLTQAAEIFGRHVPGFECLEGKGQNTFLLQGDIAQAVQAGAGLGVEINRDGLARYQQLRQELGPSNAAV